MMMKRTGNPRTVRVEPLTHDAFAPFGGFAALVPPSGEFIGQSPIEFFRDALPLSLGQSTNVSFSTCRIGPRPLIVDVLEYHTLTGETMMALDGDMIVQVAPASASHLPPPVERLRAFQVPQGVMVMLRPGVWHHAPFTVENRVLHVQVALPERTYANDCIVMELPPDQRVELVR